MQSLPPENSSPKPSDVEVLPDPTLRWLSRKAQRAGRGWDPVTTAQKNALDSKADILMLGGSAGSLKTSTILVDLIQERQFPNMRSYFFRRMYSELEGGGGAIDQARELFPNVGGVYNEGKHTWKFPSGAEFYFRHCQFEKNVYSYQGHAMTAIGIDESTHWPMKFIRYLITRNRSTDPGLKIRVRLGTNPGNIGHKEHMKLFMGGVCAHCEPAKAPKQGTLRTDARWPDDGTPMLNSEESGHPLTVSYILSNVREHTMLGSEYILRLMMQNPATAKALLAGCWRQFEGQYFDIWDYKRMTVPIQLIPVEWWWPHWISGDYGYSGSAAAAHMFTRSPGGTIYVLQEYPSGDIEGARRQTVRVYAQGVYDAFVKRDMGQEQARRIEAMYLGPDSWNDRGDEHTLAGQMNDVLEPHGLEFDKADNDRAGGAQLLYTGLQYDELKVAQTCTNTIEAIESRIHDEEEPMKVKKVKEDPLDDYYDSLRYGYYTYLEAETKPESERVKERMRKIVERAQSEGDSMGLTSAILQHAKITKEEEAADSEDQTYVGGSLRRRLQQKQQK